MTDPSHRLKYKLLQLNISEMNRGPCRYTSRRQKLDKNRRKIAAISFLSNIQVHYAILNAQVQTQMLQSLSQENFGSFPMVTAHAIGEAGLEVYRSEKGYVLLG